MSYTPTPTGEDVASFLGQGDIEQVVALAEEHVAIITALARSYTRDNGFTSDGTAREDICAVITAATARLVANPEQIHYSAGAQRLSGGFKGWSLAEQIVLNRYRRRSA